MTEKNYGGANPRSKASKNIIVNKNSQYLSRKTDKLEKIQSFMNVKDKESLLKAGEISKKVKDYIKTIVKKDILMLQLAEEIEAKIIELGGKNAFPVNLSINDIAAHHTSSYNDVEKTHGLLKIDFGVAVNGLTADGAISFDLEDLEENKNLILVAEEALKEATELVLKNKEKTKINEIGLVIENTMSKHKLQPIINLTGHSIEKNNLHAGITIPNTDNGNDSEIEEGIYAIEPFSTLSTGVGKVYDSRPSGIYHLIERKPVRDNTAREILDFIQEEYKTLPFCSRWLVKKFGTKALISLRQLEQTGALHHYQELVEQSHKKVAQAEHTILIDKGEVIVVN